MGDWLIPERETERARVLVRQLGLTPVTAHLLAQRGIEAVDQARGFLEPSLGALHDPGGLPGMEAATARLEAAIAAGEPVLLFGDYDVDGTTGAAILENVLSAQGARVSTHIPNRDEGYGLSSARLEQAARDGVRVVVSIDNGIAAVAEAARARELGLDLIVVDHHTFGEELPQATALVHPRLPGSSYPNPHLCGAGVAFKLAWALSQRLAGGRVSPRVRELLLAQLGLVALGTIADVVPLVDENRALVRFGLRALSKSSAPGIRALLELAKLTDEPVDSTAVAFRLAPRLNAAGRMGDARRAFRLLTSTDAGEAAALARELDEENKRRKTLQERVTREACAEVEAVYGADVPAAGIVVGSADWPHGIVGIVAARLAERYRRPALVVALEGESAKGSGRSRGEVDLLRALELAAPHLTRYGGHAAAVGFSLQSDQLPALREAFSRGVAQALTGSPDTPWRELLPRLEGYEVVGDVEVGLEELSRELVQELEQLSPFGEGNREPLFVSRDVTLAGEPRLLGSTGQHVAFHIRQGEAVVRTVAWSRPELWEQLREQARPGPTGQGAFQVAFRPRLNRWRGEARLELELAAIRF